MTKMTKKVLTLISLFLLISCSGKKETMLPNTDLKILTTDFRQWWNYYSKNIILSSDFSPLDEDSNQISKEAFLKKLTSGNYIPLKLISKDNSVYYQLYRLDKTAASGIKGTLKNVSEKAYHYFKMEGTKFPRFSFTDLNGNHYTNENTKGKTLILKCWFISCKPCVAEFPELNRLVKKYQDRKDMLFISLAFDSEKELVDFLINNPFSYAVVPDQKDFMVKTLKIYSYPTHFIIDQEGVIRKVVNKAEEMFSVLDKENMAVREKQVKKPPLPPPPPPPPSPSKK